MNTKRLALALPAVLALVGLSLLRADSPNYPTDQQVMAAEEASDLLISSVVAAVVDTVVATTPENVEEGNTSLSLIFDDRNPSIRLVGEEDPLSETNRPRGEFERQALNLALTGNTYSDVQRLRGKWVLRRSVPLANGVAQCSLCHTNYGAPAADDYVGALMVVVPISRISE